MGEYAIIDKTTGALVKDIKALDGVLLVNPGGHGDLPPVVIAENLAASVALADCPTFDLGGYDPVVILVEAGDGNWSVQPYFADEDSDDAFLIPQSLEALGYGSFGYTATKHAPMTIVSPGSVRFVNVPRGGRYMRLVPILNSGVAADLAMLVGGTI